MPLDGAYSNASAYCLPSGQFVKN